MEQVGTNRGAVSIEGSEARTTVDLDLAIGRRSWSAALADRAAADGGASDETRREERFYLQLEAVRGSHDASMLEVYLDLSEGTQPGDSEEHLAGTAGLYGLRRASIDDRRYGGDGRGLSFSFDITEILRVLSRTSESDIAEIEVRIVPGRPLPPGTCVTIGRIWVGRQEWTSRD